MLDKNGPHVGLFIGDYFARPSKRSGAWMSGFRSQHKLGKAQAPIIVNVLNFTKGADGEPALLSFDDARTLFHEFGHALHGLLSNVTYPSISGTIGVARFRRTPFATLRALAVDAGGARKACAALQDRASRCRRRCCSASSRREISIRASRRSNTRRRRSSTWHSIPLKELVSADVERFERETLTEIGMPREIVMRHRLPHFMHIMSGYAAGYYSYLWSEVMDADAFAAFEEAGDVFHPSTAKKLHEFIYSAGNRRDPHAAYVAFRGRPPKIDGLLKKRGLAA